MLLTDGGNVFSWGGNRFGQLGHGDRKDRKTPTKVDALKGREVSKIVLGIVYH
jgi:alpha-tubulin suppressor-like RCC1 family protein